MKRKDKKGRILRTGEYQRKDGRYQFSKMKDKKRYTIYDRDLNSLREKEILLMQEISNGIKTESTIYPTLDTYAQYWFETYGMQGRKPSTIQLYKNSYNKHLRDKIGNIPINELKRYDLQSAFNNLLAKGLKSSTVEIIKYCIHNILEMAVDEEFINRNPARGIILPKEPKKYREALKKEDLKQFFDFLSKDKFYSFYEPFFQVLFFTGMRVGECCALTWEDVDFENRTIRVNKTQIRLNKEIYIGTPKSRSSFRVVPMNDIVYKSLCRLYKKRGGERDVSKSSLQYISDTGRICGIVSDFLFFSTRNRILTESTVRQIIIHITLKKTNMKKINKFVPHQSRHTFASLAYEAGLDVKYTSLILGHSSINTTMDSYTHLSETFINKQGMGFYKLKI